MLQAQGLQEFLTPKPPVPLYHLGGHEGDKEDTDAPLPTRPSTSVWPCPTSLIRTQWPRIACTVESHKATSFG